MINPSCDWPMKTLVLELISYSNKAEQLAQTNVERQKRVRRPLFTQMQEADVLIPSEAWFPLEVPFELAWLPKFKNVALDYQST